MPGPDPAADLLPIPHPDVVARQVGDDVVLVHLDTSQIFALNATGARFWELLSDGKSRVEIEETILQITPYAGVPRAINAMKLLRTEQENEV